MHGQYGSWPMGGSGRTIASNLKIVVDMIARCKAAAMAVPNRPETRRQTIDINSEEN